MSNTPKRGTLGKQIEKQVEALLKARSDASIYFAYHRYPDTRAARGMIAAQPADFLVGSGYPTRRVWHLEVKDTAETRRLPIAKVGQYGKLGIWRSAGIQPVVLVYRSAFGDWVVLSEDDLFSSAETPKSFPFDGLMCFDTPDEALNHIFNT